MKNNTYNKLSAIPVKGLVEKKGKFDYLSWATAWHLLKTEYPDAQRKVYECDQTGLNFFTDGKTAYVKVGVTIEGVEHIDYLPVMNHVNNRSFSKVSVVYVNRSLNFIFTISKKTF